MAEEMTTATQNAQNDAGATQTPTANNDSPIVENATQNAQNDSQEEKKVDIEALIQKAVDRATNKLGNDNKKLREQLDSLKKEKLTDDEIKKLELADKEADIADREAKLKEKENRLFAIKAIKDEGLDDGSSNALDLVDFVMADSEEATMAKIKIFSNLVKKFVSAEVTRTFQSKGRNPEKGGTNEGGSKNHTVVESIGVLAADRQETSEKVLNYYLGGNK